MRRIMKAFGKLLLSLALTGIAGAQTTNSWISVGAGNWHSAGNWSAGSPSNNQARVQITNATSKAVFINAATTNLPGTMTINNLLVSAPIGSTNSLLLNGSGLPTPLRILNNFTL